MMFLSAWIGHTDKSRIDAQCMRVAISALGWKFAYVAERLGVNEKRLVRQLAGQEPLNHWRLAELPDEFHRAYDRAKAQIRGAAILEAEDVSVLRGVASLGRRRMLKIFPELVEKRRRA